jgi:small basic protein
MMSNKAYDTLKLIALIAAPVSVFIVAVLSALGVPQTDTVTAILAALDTLLGSLVEIFRRQYEKQFEVDG